MAGLDDLYGPGSSDGFRTAVALPGSFGSATFIESTQPDGSVVVDCRWTNGGWMRIRCETETIFFIGLEAERPGFYSALVKTDVPDWARSVGIKSFTADARDLESLGILKTRGAWLKRAGTNDEREIIWYL